jgi:hypothetical protein
MGIVDIRKISGIISLMRVREGEESLFRRYKRSNPLPRVGEKAFATEKPTELFRTGISGKLTREFPQTYSVASRKNNSPQMSASGINRHGSE